MPGLKAKLRIVWANYAPKRYVPRAMQRGPGWRVFDKKENRFLTDGEVQRVPEDRLQTDIVVN